MLHFYLGPTSMNVNTQLRDDTTSCSTFYFEQILEKKLYRQYNKYATNIEMAITGRTKKPDRDSNPHTLGMILTI